MSPLGRVPSTRSISSTCWTRPLAMDMMCTCVASWPTGRGLLPQLPARHQRRRSTRSQLLQILWVRAKVKTSARNAIRVAERKCWFVQGSRKRKGAPKKNITWFRRWDSQATQHYNGKRPTEPTQSSLGHKRIKATTEKSQSLLSATKHPRHFRATKGPKQGRSPVLVHMPARHPGRQCFWSCNGLLHHKFASYSHHHLDASRHSFLKLRAVETNQ